MFLSKKTSSDIQAEKSMNGKTTNQKNEKSKPKYKKQDDTTTRVHSCSSKSEFTDEKRRALNMFKPIRIGTC